MTIQSLNSQALGASVAPQIVGKSDQAQQGPAFKDVLLNSIREVNDAQQEADRAVEALFTGGDVNPAEVLTAVQKADLAFRMMMQIRNKLVAAYDEVKSIRV
jgi:flagellar hook-basal body complex protein FliE